MTAPSIKDGTIIPAEYNEKTAIEAMLKEPLLIRRPLVIIDDHRVCGFDHPKVQELREMMAWSEGQVWCSPERHGAMSAVFKAQIDWVPLAMGAVRPTQGKTLAVMQVSGGSQSFNAVNQMRILGRWMRMLTIPNQSSIPKAWLEFGEGERLPEGPFYRRLVDVMEELVKFTWLVRGRKDYLTDRYSERLESAQEVHQRVSQK